MTIKSWSGIVCGCIGLGAIVELVCVFASYIVIRFLYPNEFEGVKELFVVANLAQIVHFITGILTTILLRYVKEKYQLYINIAYVVAFFIGVIPATWKYRIWGFATAVLVVNCFRMLTVCVLMIKKISTGKIDGKNLN